MDFSDTFILCWLAPGIGLDQDVHIFVNSKTGTFNSQPAGAVSYANPAVYNVSGCQIKLNSIQNCSRTANETLIISGNNFGASKTTVQVCHYLSRTRLSSF